MLFLNVLFFYSFLNSYLEKRRTMRILKFGNTIIILINSINLNIIIVKREYLRENMRGE